MAALTWIEDPNMHRSKDASAKCEWKQGDNYTRRIHVFTEDTQHSAATSA